MLRVAVVDDHPFIVKVMTTAIELGADGVISKRSGPAEVCDAIRRVAGG
jgi:DNA-binding NarL/FixJ family response regulator